MRRLVEIKKRMRTIADIQNVARTMATVASAKLSRTRAQATGMRVYVERTRDILRRQQGYLDAIGVPLEHVSPLFVEQARVDRVVLVHLSGDRGMCGNYNVAIDRLAADEIESWESAGVQVALVSRGAKGESYLRKRTDVPILDHATWPRAGVTAEFVDDLVGLVSEAFMAGQADEVWCAYTRYCSPVRREPTLVRLLPIRPDRLDDGAPQSLGTNERWAYEPSFSAIVLEILSTYLKLQIEDVLLESYASEQGARMVTMEEATERAGKRLHECRVLYNRLRREFITTDLLGVLFASRVRSADDGSEEREEVVLHG